MRTAAVARYFRDLIYTINAGSFDKHLPAIADDASLRLFDMEDFRGPSGAREAIRYWSQSFPGLVSEMTEFINPDGPEVLCIGRLTGDGATSGATVGQDLVLRIKVADGMAVEMSLTNRRAEALEAIGLRSERARRAHTEAADRA